MNSHRIDESDYDSTKQNNDNQTTFLKRKLIETHQKLLKQLELTKQLEEQISLGEMKNQQLKIENDSLKRKLQSRAGQDNKGNDKKLKQLENKNNLLRNDLEAMRTRIIAEMLERTKLEESIKAKIEVIEELEHNIRKLGNQLKKKDSEMHSKLEDYNQIKHKYDQLYEDSNQLKNLCEDLKRKQNFFSNRINDLENFLKTEKDKSLIVINQKKVLQKELSVLRNKVGDNGMIVADLNNKIQLEEKQKQRLKSVVEKLTYEINQMSMKYKVKEKELADQKSRPDRQLMKQRQNFMESKELVEKLEYQQRQKQKTSHRKFRMETSPSKSLSPLRYASNQSPPKRDYMDNITEMGKLENILLQSNITRNKLMTEIDKIEGVKTKTNEIYLKRKQYQEELNRIEQIITQTKARLRVLNAM